MHMYKLIIVICITYSPYSTPSEIDWRLFLAVLQAQKGNTYFTELAERAEYGSYVCV